MEQTPEEFQEAATIFAKACIIPLEERTLFLERACGHNTKLRAYVQRLLDNDAHPAFQLHTPAIALAAMAEGSAIFDNRFAPTDNPQRIGGYVIIGILGEGGMGIVYEAQQKHPARHVALKVLRPSVVSKSAKKRLQTEAEILGKLQHPGIAAIYEAGMAPNDQHLAGSKEQPFFAMELIRGEPLDEYTKKHALTITKRMELFADICDAVHHAHENGIIHRDLKPGNILVDSLGVPKILDFGIARVTDADVRTTTLQTGIGQLIGTIAYMSPEQVTGDSSKLDNRSDVYALGVIGYELLCGTRPYELMNIPIPEAVRLIREFEPQSLCSVNTIFRGDLDTIFSKALEKDRERRYQSAADLVDDIRHYLLHEPIVAKPSSMTYLMKKFVKRNRATVAGLVGIFLTLIVGIAATGWQAYRATVALERAEDEATISGEISQFLHDMLSSVNPKKSNTSTITVREVVDEAALRIDSAVSQYQPRVESSIRATLGSTYIALAQYSAAEHQLRKSISLYDKVQSIPDAHAAELLYLLGNSLIGSGNTIEAEELLHKALSILKTISRENTKESANILNNLAAIQLNIGEFGKAETLNREVLALRKEMLGDNHQDTARSLNNLAVVLRKKGDLPGAEQAYRQALTIYQKHLGNHHIEVANVLSNIGMLCAYQGDFDQAESYLTDSLGKYRTLLSSNHPKIASNINGLAGILHSKGKYDKAEILYREAISIWEQSLGLAHRKVALGYYNLASLLHDSESLDDALSLARKAVAIYRKQQPMSKQNLAEALFLEGIILLDLDNHDTYAQAEIRILECLDLRRQFFPEDHIRIAETASRLGECIMKQQRFAEAEPWLVESYPVILNKKGKSHKNTQTAISRLVQLYEAWDRKEQAQQWRKQLASLEH